MKVIPKVLAGESYEHKGNLTIEGDIGKGAKIIVGDGSLTINGNVKSNAQLSINLSEEFRNKLMKTNTYFGNVNVILKINGEIFDNVTINSDAAIEANKIGKNCIITSKYEGITAKDIQQDTKINVRDAIDLENVGSNCILESSQYGLKAKKLDDRVVVKVRDAIEVEDIGKHCYLSSAVYGLTGGNVDDGAMIKVRDAIVLKNIGSNCDISNTQYGIKAKTIGNKNQIKVRDQVSLKAVGDYCLIISQQYDIEVQETVGDNNNLIARDVISAGSLGHNSALTSSQNKVKVTGNSGNNIIISARNSVHLKDVGDKAQIISQQDEVSVRNIGINATITARSDIDIDGTCPNPASLKLNTRGNIRRPTQTVMQSSAPLNNFSEFSNRPSSSSRMGSNIINYDIGRTYNYSGMGSNVIDHDIEPNSTVKMSGMGSLVINGRINQNATVIFSGMGKLTINGTVDESVKFKISGMGNVNFTRKPPQHVLDNMTQSGMGSVTFGGQQFTQASQTSSYSSRNVLGSGSINTLEDINISHIGEISAISHDGLLKLSRNGTTTTYAGETSSTLNGRLYIDGREVIENDPRILYVENTSDRFINNAPILPALPVWEQNTTRVDQRQVLYPQSSNHESNSLINNNFASSYSLIRSALPTQVQQPQTAQSQQSSILLEDYSRSTKAYINGFQKKQKNTEMLKNLKLTADQETLLEDFRDPITEEVINIPVRLDGRLYDLNTLMEIQQKGDRLDPYSRDQFVLRDIQPARKEAALLEEIVQQIKTEYERTLLEDGSDHIISELQRLHF